MKCDRRKAMKLAGAILGALAVPSTKLLAGDEFSGKIRNVQFWQDQWLEPDIWHKVDMVATEKATEFFMNGELVGVHSSDAWCSTMERRAASFWLQASRRMHIREASKVVRFTNQVDVGFEHDGEVGADVVLANIRIEEVYKDGHRDGMHWPMNERLLHNHWVHCSVTRKGSNA